MKEYMCERGATRGGGLDQARRGCLDRERLRLFCLGHPLGGRSRKELGVRAIDRLMKVRLKARKCSKLRGHHCARARILQMWVVVAEFFAKQKVYSCTCQVNVTFIFDVVFWYCI